MKTKLSHGQKKYVRRQKAQLRRQFQNLEEQRKSIVDLYERLGVVVKKSLKV